MAKLVVVRTDGREQEFEITPLLEYAFEKYANKGFHKAMLEDAKQTNWYWLCWEAVRRSGETVKPFGEDFIETLKSVDIVESDPLA